MRFIYKKNRPNLLVFLLFLLFILGCGASQETGSTSPAAVDLELDNVEADENIITFVIKNNGTADAGSFRVDITLDEIFVENPTNKSVTVSSLAAGETTTLEVSNTLTSSDGKGQHYAYVKVNTDEAVDETSLVDNYRADYYYDGDYPQLYSSVYANYRTWRDELKDRVESYYGWPTDKAFNMHLMDYVSSEGEGVNGLRTTRYIVNEDTSVLLFNLESLNAGYETFTYNNQTYSKTSSQEVVQHEYTHAYHRNYIVENSGVNNWNSVPTWFKEGLAVLTSFAGPNYVRNEVYYHKHLVGNSLATAKSQLLRDLDDSVHYVSDYSRDYLALCYIYSAYGLSTLAQIITDNAQGTEIKDAILNNLPAINSWSDFKAAFQAYAEEYIDEVWPKIPDK